jgi:hypothetical protein
MEAKDVSMSLKGERETQYKSFFMNSKKNNGRWIWQKKV